VITPLAWVTWWCATASLCVFALRRAALTAASLRRRSLPELGEETLPRFWVLVAVRNEARNVNRLCSTLRQLDYPAMKVLIADDASEDDTARLLRAVTDPAWTVLPSSGGPRGKAAVLRAAATTAGLQDDDLLLVLDADHTMSPTSLHDLLPWFDDLRTQAVAFAHRVRTPDRSLTTIYCTLEGAVSEEVTGRGKAALGLGVSLSGSWAARARAFLDHYPDGEEFADDATFAARLYAAGWKVEFADNVVSTHDVPTSVGVYLRQHIRWSKGLYDVGRRQAAGLVGAVGQSVRSRIDWLMTAAGYAERPIALAWLLSSLILWLTGTNIVALIVPPALSASVVLAQIVLALARIGASARMWLLTPVAVVTLAAVDVVAATGGALDGVARRVGWRPARS